jgi:hypothetical protein
VFWAINQFVVKLATEMRVKNKSKQKKKKKKKTEVAFGSV